jgi:EAL domain-containing protein (putative c-di-GMP-specific phosphodiesterase class I)
MDRPTNSKGKVLLVDDDPGICRDYARLLRRQQLTVETASNGRDALKRLTHDVFDTVLTDIGMPDMGGVDFLRAIREHDRDLPVIFMTGTPTLETAVKAVEYGATQYLVKPIHSDALSEAIWHALDLRHDTKLRRTARVSPGPIDRQSSIQTSLAADFERALGSLWMAFQPIVQAAERNVFAYEALVRSDEPALSSPAALFNASEGLHRTEELGRVIRATIAQSASNAPSGALLFVNIDAEELNDHELISDSAPLSKIAGRVVLEITGRSALDGIAGVRARFTKLRAVGYRIAVGDLGAGHAGFASISQLAPDFVKLQMSLVRGVHRSTRKRALIRDLARACSADLGVQVICEGIELPEERDALVSDGLNLFQGYLFARPERGFSTPKW